ncbi:MAG: hypothetical protein EXS16_11215 [Gemmataceae bacterium]|nr:hypothetical protein [Gemmataceae bacterium]
MRFALLGEHPDGLDLARALVATGSHHLRAFAGTRTGQGQVESLGTIIYYRDLEEVLADPDIDAVIVATPIAQRPAHLRRALQSERHVFCVHPADPSPDVAYEAAMIQADTNRVLLPMLPMALHPAMARFTELMQATVAAQVLELEIASSEEVLQNTGGVNPKPSLPGWDVLRRVGGEVDAVYVQTGKSAFAKGEPLLLSGRFLSGLLFRATLLPSQAAQHWRIALVTPTARITLDFPDGWPGPARLNFVDAAGQSQTETWPAHHPWEALIRRFEEAVETSRRRIPRPGQIDTACLTNPISTLGWQDELRALELDDAARRCVVYGRVGTLDHQEATEEASFKGTMTLVGCSLIWLTVVVLILSTWQPWLAWAILPLFAVFLVMQTLRWIIPSQR